MKKLNRKGFTLVELLAVIIILAIVVGISIPAITNIISDVKNNALQTQVNSAEKYLTEQYGLMNVEFNTSSSNFRTVFAPGTYTVGTEKALTKAANADLLKEIGLSTDNVSTVNITIKTDGSVCVEVKEIPVTTSEYYSTQYWTTTDGTLAEASTTKAPSNKSKSC